MNERIQELAEQAVSRFDKDMDGSMEPTENGRWVYYDDLTEFAELIVRECAKLARDTDLEDVEGGDSEVLRAAKRQILEHFGVEE